MKKNSHHDGPNITTKLGNEASDGSLEIQLLLLTNTQRPHESPLALQGEVVEWVFKLKYPGIQVSGHSNVLF
jgi:hypothetical protein